MPGLHAQLPCRPITKGDESERSWAAPTIAAAPRASKDPEIPARRRAAAAAVGTAPDPKRRSSRPAGKPAAASETRVERSDELPPPEQAARPERAADGVPPSADPAAARAVSADPDPAAVPAVNPAAPRHAGRWFWLLKAEPESRLERGVDVRFSIDDMRAKTATEPWDGIRAYAARNNLRCMNAGDMTFFYHSNCKEPAIAGTMEIVREFSEDKSARRLGSPYYDPVSTRAAPRWGLVHVEFRSKFALPIPLRELRELRELGRPGGPLADMQMLRQPRLSVSRVSRAEWEALFRIADDKAAAAGLKHEAT